jgi:hypothetical protein
VSHSTLGSNLLTCAWNRCAPNQAKVAHRPSPINNIRPKYILSLIGVTRRVICKSAWRPPTPRSPHRKHREKWRPDLFHTPALHSGGNRVAKRIWPGRAMWTIRARALTPNRRVRDGDEPRCPTRRRRRRRTSLSSSLPLFHRYSGAACGAQRRVQGGGVRGIVHTTTSVPRRIRPSSPTETGRGAPAGAGRRRP